MNSVKHQQSWSKPVERPQSLGSVVQRKGRKTGGAVEIGSDSDDHDAPVAQQMLSFVMDDPDFESEELDVPKIKKVENH